MVKKKPIKKPKKYICKSCGKEFFKLSKKLLKKEDKGFTCPYCESEYWKPLKNK